MAFVGPAAAGSDMTLSCQAAAAAQPGLHISTSSAIVTVSIAVSCCWQDAGPHAGVPRFDSCGRRCCL